MVKAILVDFKLNTFAALPVGASNLVLNLLLESTFTNVPRMEVFPVPANPFNKNN